jgi:lactate permease
VLGAIFVYDVTVKSGDFEVVKDTIAGVGSDRRIQVLLIAFCFGAFIEGAAGFGTPVAISAAMLIGLGFRPLQAAGLALIANTAPVAFGALGIPSSRWRPTTGLPVDLLSAMTGRILVLFCVAVPFWVVWTMCGRKQMMEVWPACLTTGLTFRRHAVRDQQLHRRLAGGHRRFGGFHGLAGGAAEVLAAGHHLVFRA